MAKKKVAPATDAPVETDASTTVTIGDLATEFNLEARIIRAFIRKLGFKAPAIVDAVGFGPKSKYEWSSDSTELAEIRKAVKASITE